MPDLDYALLADYVRTEGGLAHIIGAGIDRIWAPQVPTGQNVALLARFRFARAECGRPHRLEVIFQDADGERLAQMDAVVEPEWPEGTPLGWGTPGLLGLNIGVPLPVYGTYSFEVMLNDSLMKSIPLAVSPPEGSGSADE